MRKSTSTSVRPLRNSHSGLTGQLALFRGGTATFESSLERDWLTVLDFDPDVEEIRVQPFTLTYELDGVVRRYTPDVFVAYDQGAERGPDTVYEVKPHDVLRDRWLEFRPRFMEAIKYCRENGWIFRIVTERQIRTPYWENASFLRTYRHHPEDELCREQLLYVFKALGETTPQALLAAAYPHDADRMAALPMLWKMIATRRISVLLTEEITMASPIWLES